MLVQLREDNFATIISIQEEKDEALAELETLKNTSRTLLEMHKEDMTEIERLRNQIQSESLCSNR